MIQYLKKNIIDFYKKNKIVDRSMAVSAISNAFDAEFFGTVFGYILIPGNFSYSFIDENDFNKIFGDVCGKCSYSLKYGNKLQKFFKGYKNEKEAADELLKKITTNKDINIASSKKYEIWFTTPKMYYYVVGKPIYTKAMEK